MSSEKACFTDAERAFGSLRLPLGGGAQGRVPASRGGAGGSLCTVASRVRGEVQGDKGSLVISTFSSSSGLFGWRRGSVRVRTAVRGPAPRDTEEVAFCR